MSVLDDIMRLPNDVANRTFQHRAEDVQQAYTIANSWLDVIQSFAKECPLQIQAFAVYESFDASLYNAVTGWYRTAGVTLRAGVDDLLTGLYFQINGDRATFDTIVSGKERTRPFRQMREAVLEATSDAALFGYPQGAYGALYEELSVYTHRLSHGELLDGSNGPVYSDKPFDRWFDEYNRADRTLKAAIDAGRNFA